MRFDDSLATVLSADAATDAGANVTWRQLIDLIGRGRAPGDADTIARLRAMRASVPEAVRAASARALAFAEPGAALVAFVAEDTLAVSAPVLRTATLAGEDWAAIIPRLGPVGRSVLRARRDLPTAAVRALDSLGPTDLALAFEGEVAPAPPLAPLDLTPDAIIAPPPPDPQPEAEPASQIAELVARIDAFRRDQPVTDVEGEGAPSCFHFSADASGTIGWADRPVRALLVGATIGRGGIQGRVRFDATVGDDGTRTLEIAGRSELAGEWRVGIARVVDPASGRLTGYRGAARRPSIEPPRRSTDALRQVVHELRTPANAVVGFAELIEMQLLGIVPEPYRGRAATIRTEAADVLAAIDDLDLAARLEGNGVEPRPATVAMLPLLRRLVADLQPVARARQVTLTLRGASAYREAWVDDRLAERLLDRLLRLLLTGAGAGATIGVTIRAGTRAVKIAIEAPAAALSRDDDPAPPPTGSAMLPGRALLWALCDALVERLDGSLLLKATRLTLRLPAASDIRMTVAPDPQ